MNKINAHQSFTTLPTVAGDLLVMQACCIGEMASRMKREFQARLCVRSGWLSVSNKQKRSKYDYKYSVLIFVFATLLKQQWLEIDDLEGWSSDKIENIEAIVNIER
ncbi:hypothetical protein [Desulfogranum marinum]|uniref:hypothetical protein n=1 Tax=Desulfogranum marinum TaxID=453220 RepID=UPI0029C78207|nr:hypothetical protein [Desulfogranum marinum]